MPAGSRIAILSPFCRWIAVTFSVCLIVGDVELNTMGSAIRHPKDAAVAIRFTVPTCIEGHATKLKGHAAGLVQGVDYHAVVTVKRGTKVIVESNCQLEDCSFQCSIPALTLTVHTVRVSVLDRFAGLSAEESLLSTMIKKLEVHSNVKQDAQREDNESPEEFGTGQPTAPVGQKQSTGSYMVKDFTGSIVSICACVTSKPGFETGNNANRTIRYPASVKETSLQLILVPSIERTITSDERYLLKIRLHLGMDDDDIFWLHHADELQSPEWLDVRVAVFRPAPNKVPFNLLMRQAFDDGADYLVRINDDTQFLTPGWILKGISTLQSHSTPNVGVVGPTCPNDEKRIIMTHDMVHRTHLQIFTDYYPEAFSSWWVDDWISLVYEPGIFSTKLESWVVDHPTQMHGRRYQVQNDEKGYLGTEISKGRVRIHEWIHSQTSWSRKVEEWRKIQRQNELSAQGVDFDVVARVGAMPFAKHSAWVLSYSLYGSDPRYTDGALENAELYSVIYPGWTMRVYHDNTVPAGILEYLQEQNVQLFDMSASLLANKMSWRFSAASDGDVARFCSRDIDSRLSHREKAAVEEWVDSGRKFHVMRDHPSHSKSPMSGGMWCGTSDSMPDMVQSLAQRRMQHQYSQDMEFLTDVVWPIAKMSVLQHDSFSCEKYGGKAFPTPRNGWEHVGSVYIDGKMREGDIDILRNAKIPEACRNHAESVSADDCPKIVRQVEPSHLQDRNQRGMRKGVFGGGKLGDHDQPWQVEGAFLGDPSDGSVMREESRWESLQLRRCLHGHLFFDRCFCDAGFRGDACDTMYKEMLPCIDNPMSTFPNDLSAESGTDRCFQHDENGRMVPPDGFSRWLKAQDFEANLWASSSLSNDRIETHLAGYQNFSALKLNVNLGSLLEVGCGPYTQTTGLLSTLPDAKVTKITLFDPNINEYMERVKYCAYGSGSLAKYPDGSGFWPYPVETTETMPTHTEFDTVVSCNVITHVQNGYTWLEDLYKTIKCFGLLVFSDYWFDGTHENFWYVPDAYYHPVRPFRKVYDHFFTHFELVYEHVELVPIRHQGLTDHVGYWILRKRCRKL